MKTTTRKFLKQYDLEIGLECGIEWGLPNGSLRVLEKGIMSNEYRVCLETYYDGVAHYHIGNVKNINKWMHNFDYI